MERKEIIEKLTEIFRKVLAVKELELNDQMTADDVDTWDSLSHMLLITEIEETFNIKFRLRELNKMKNVGALIDILESKLD